MTGDGRDSEWQAGTGEGPEVTRSVDLAAAPDDVWEVVADPEQRRLWLDDDDAVGRVVLAESVHDGRSLAWTWWLPDDPGTTTRVEIVLTELDGGGTRVAVTERMIGGAPLVARASASVRAGTLWDRRLLGLELLFLAAGICVG